MEAIAIAGCRAPSADGGGGGGSAGTPRGKWASLSPRLATTGRWLCWAVGVGALPCPDSLARSWLWGVGACGPAHIYRD